MPRLSTPVRTQPPGDERCISYAVAAAMETALCRQRQTVEGIPEISVDDVFRQGGSEVGSIGGLIGAAAAGVSDAVCCPPGSAGRCTDPATHLWRARIELVAGPRETRVTLMRQLLRIRGPLVSFIQIFPDFVTFTGAGTYKPAQSGASFHAVCIVGDEVNADGTGNWIAKNSMGPQWGDEGYVRMAWGDSALKAEGIVYVVDGVVQ